MKLKPSDSRSDKINLPAQDCKKENKTYDNGIFARFICNFLQLTKRPNQKHIAIDCFDSGTVKRRDKKNQTVAIELIG